jgi:hypothetical protein
MADIRTTQPRSGLVSGARWALLALAGLFTLGALAQFFLVGMGMFEDGSRWQDHANLGHVLGLVTYVMWIPAVIGRMGARLIVATIALLVLFGLQYAFMESDSTMMKAFHPLNGSVLLVLGFWVTLRGIGQLRTPSMASGPAHEPEPGLPDRFERTST